MADLTTKVLDFGHMTSHVTGHVTGLVTEMSLSGEYQKEYTWWQITYIFIGSLGLFGNAFVIMVIFNSKAMKQVITNTLIINQSIVDGLAGLVLILVNILADDEVPDFSLWYKVVCSFWYSHALLWALFSCSSYNLMAITAERLIAVCHPLWHKTSFTPTKQILVLLLIWIAGPIVNVALAIIDSHVTEGICYSFGSGNRMTNVLGLLSIINQFIVPAVFIIACYTTIAVKLHLRSKHLQHHQPALVLNKNKSIHGGKHIIKIMAIVSLCFLVCWTTNEVIFFMYLIGHPLYVDGTLYNLSVVAVFANCCCNPFVYIFKYKEFQNGVKAWFRCSPNTVEPVVNTSQT